jgi:hypothetical protein
VAQKAFVTAWKKCRVDYFCCVIEAEAACPRLSGRKIDRLDPFKNGRPRTEALTQKRKKSIYGWGPAWLMAAVDEHWPYRLLGEGTILP